MPMTPKQMVALLEKNGLIYDHSSRSHRVFYKEGFRPVTVPYHAKELSKGLEQAILKQAGLK